MKMTKKNYFWLMGFTALSVFMAGFCILLGTMGKGKNEINSIAVSAQEQPIQVIIDPGHGGEDGGCVAVDGTLEKDLNLEISKKVCMILKAAGINAVLSRDKDIMLYDMYGDLHDYTNVKKTYDLKNRVRYAKESDPELFVSIHMNKFSDSTYSGFQVYYSDNESESITAALRIQKYVTEFLQPDNDREIKKAGSNIYILHRASVPAVLCECGFLSNADERELLKDEEYQKRLAFSIAMGVIESLYCIEEGEN